MPAPLTGFVPTTDATLDLASEHQYAHIEPRPGESLLGRTELGGDPEAFVPGTGKVLLRLLHLSDLHVMDAGSPARADWVEARAHDPRWHPLLHMARPFDTLANWGVGAMVASIRRAAEVGGVPFDLAVATGDNIDNAQRNELDAYLGLLDGGSFRLPYDGPQRASWAAAVLDDRRADDLLVDGLWPFWLPDGLVDDVWRTVHGFPLVQGLLDDAGSPLHSPGLGIPWLGVLGNHDVMRQGTVFTTPALEAIAVGSWRAIGAREGFAPDNPLESYLADPAAFSDGQPRHTIEPDAGRRSVTSEEFIRAHIDSAGARGTTHGFSGGSGDYVHETEHVTIVVLDTNHPTGHYQGSVGEAQLAWLDSVLAAAGSRPVLVCSHHGEESIDNTYANPDPCDRQLGDAVAAVLHRHDNVLAWLSGHRHVHRVRPCPDPLGVGRGFWAITTTSIIDWPCQARMVEVVAAPDGTIGLRTTVIDHDAVDTSSDAPTEVRLAALHRELAANTARVRRRLGSSGKPTDRNVLLPRA